MPQRSDLCGPIEGQRRDEASIARTVAGHELGLVALDLDCLGGAGVADELDPQAELVGPEECGRRREQLEPEQAPRSGDTVCRGARPVTWATRGVAGELDTGHDHRGLTDRLDSDGDERDVARHLAAAAELDGADAAGAAGAEAAGLHVRPQLDAVGSVTALQERAQL